MRILVTGHTGLLGTELVPVLAAAGHQVHGCSLPDHDITEPASARQAVDGCRAELVIHAAAWTAVDACEADPDRAYRVNALGTRNMVLAAREAGAAFAFISTDYVFDGTKHEPYLEYDPTNPTSAYGRSKWAGEQYVRYLHDRYYIVRSAWLFGAGGPCFPETILRLLREKDGVDVVTDQIGNPTWAGDLSLAIARIVTSGLHGTYHAVNSGPTSWYEFAREVARTFGYPSGVVRPTTSEHFVRPAPRPAYSALRNFVLEQSLDYRMRPWLETLPEYAASTGGRFMESA
ncbi:MAG: dTDP-4-dehydrorhamnose reductase [Candidatus Eisenbacteria bacterium]|nr:dTDP-4-dehydrorhamnose reductase [Candidatus Eisenbacteria bacterium]